MRLLIVEDDPGSRKALAELLAEEGYEVRTAVNGSSALLVIAQWQPRMLLVDYSLPDMNGLELVQQVRAAGDTTPFCLVSGTSEMDIDPEGNVELRDHAIEAIAQGALAHLTKPVQYAQLLAVIEKGLRRP